MERPEVRPEPVEGYKMVMVDKKTSATAISIGFPIELLRGERDWYALAIANSWLGEHRNSSSHLYQVIREKRGLNYGDYSYIENFPRGGRRQMPPVNVPRKSQIFEIWIRPVPNETAHFALRAALREFTKLVENGMTAEEFEITRRFLKSYVLHYAPTTSLRLGYALDDKFYRVSQSHLELFRKMMDGITLEEVNAAIRKHLQTNQMVISIICTDAEALSRNISANVQSPITYQSPKSPSILAEDKEIAVFNIPVREDQIKILTLEMLFNE
jgi:zinc protease